MVDGHTHFVLLSKSSNWGSEADFKIEIAERISKGRNFPYSCKIIGILIGDNPNCITEI